MRECGWVEMVKMSNREPKGTKEVKGEQRHSNLICQFNKRSTRKSYVIQFWLNSLWGEYFYYPDFLIDYIYRADFFFLTVINTPYIYTSQRKIQTLELFHGQLYCCLCFWSSNFPDLVRAWKREFYSWHLKKKKVKSEDNGKKGLWTGLKCWFTV